MLRPSMYTIHQSPTSNLRDRFSATSRGSMRFLAVSTAPRMFGIVNNIRLPGRRKNADFILKFLKFLGRVCNSLPLTDRLPNRSTGAAEWCTRTKWKCTSSHSQCSMAAGIVRRASVSSRTHHTCGTGTWWCAEIRTPLDRSAALAAFPTGSSRASRTKRTRRRRTDSSATFAAQCSPGTRTRRRNSEWHTICGAARDRWVKGGNWKNMEIITSQIQFQGDIGAVYEFLFISVQKVSIQCVRIAFDQVCRSVGVVANMPTFASATARVHFVHTAHRNWSSEIPSSARFCKVAHIANTCGLRSEIIIYINDAEELLVMLAQLHKHQQQFHLISQILRAGLTKFYAFAHLLGLLKSFLFAFFYQIQQISQKWFMCCTNVFFNFPPSDVWRKWLRSEHSALACNIRQSCLFSIPSNIYHKKNILKIAKHIFSSLFAWYMCAHGFILNSGHATRLICIPVIVDTHSRHEWMTKKTHPIEHICHSAIDHTVNANCAPRTIHV